MPGTKMQSIACSTFVLFQWKMANAVNFEFQRKIITFSQSITLWSNLVRPVILSKQILANISIYNTIWLPFIFDDDDDVTQIILRNANTKIFEFHVFDPNGSVNFAMLCNALNSKFKDRMLKSNQFWAMKANLKNCGEKLPNVTKAKIIIKAQVWRQPMLFW